MVFRGNVRGKDPQTAYKKLRERMSAELGAEYQLFLLEDKDGKPTAVVLPRGAANEGTISRVTEVGRGTLFSLPICSNS